MALPNILKIALNQRISFYYYFLAFTELPCETDGFAGNCDNYPSTPCREGIRDAFGKVVSINFSQNYHEA